jgi:ribonuclease H2 subunit C
MFVHSVEKIIDPSSTENALPQAALDPDFEDEGEDGPAQPESVTVLEGNTTFDHVIVWGHDVLPAADDPFVKGVEEWISFAQAVRILCLFGMLRTRV